jgi:hypothetical protein
MKMRGCGCCCCNWHRTLLPHTCHRTVLTPIHLQTVGSEETYMWYGVLRWWLLRNAQVCTSSNSSSIRSLRALYHDPLLSVELGVQQ